MIRSEGRPKALPLAFTNKNATCPSKPDSERYPFPLESKDSSRMPGASSSTRVLLNVPASTSNVQGMALSESRTLYYGRLQAQQLPRLGQIQLRPLHMQKRMSLNMAGTRQCRAVYAGDNQECHELFEMYQTQE
jgi:hypothetical protein